MRSESEKSIGLLKELEEKHGGKITDRTFAIWAYLPCEREYSNGMFLYRIGDVFHYEDFDKGDMNILGFVIKRKKDKPFVKTEGSFLISEVVSVFKVTKSAARNYYLKKRSNEFYSIKKAGMLSRFFKECVYAVKLQNGDILFFQMMDNIILK